MSLKILTIQEAEAQQLNIPNTNGNSKEFIVTGSRNELIRVLTRIGAISNTEFRSKGEVHRIIASTLDDLFEVMQKAISKGNNQAEAEQIRNTEIVQNSFRKIIYLEGKGVKKPDYDPGDADVVMLTLNDKQLMSAELWRKANYPDKKVDIVVCDDNEYIAKQQERLGGTPPKGKGWVYYFYNGR